MNLLNFVDKYTFDYQPVEELRDMQGELLYPLGSKRLVETASTSFYRWRIRGKIGNKLLITWQCNHTASIKHVVKVNSRLKKEWFNTVNSRVLFADLSQNK